MKSAEKLSSELQLRLSQEIQNAHGNEVLFVAKVDPETRLAVEVIVAARGNQDTVPALYPHMVQGDVVLHNHPSGRLQPSQADLQVASQLGNEGIGFWIVNNEVTEVYAVSEPVVLKKTQRLRTEEAAGHLLPGGSFSRLIQQFEPRQAQVDLLNLFVRGFNEDAILAAEAGTGVGKSFAYLIPAILWALRNNERVVVSTATINLQQQLLEKDLPLVQRALGSSAKVVLVKGRRNYLCPSRLEEETRDPSNDGETYQDQLRLIGEWGRITKSGDVAELGFLPEDGLWGRVCSDADSCHGLKCQLKDGCFLAKSRKEASGASLLIVNHHLLFADLALRMNGFGADVTAVLPPFHRIVFDEAHNLEKSATSYFSSEFSRPFLLKLLGRLYRKRRARYTGLIVSLQGLGTDKIDFVQFPALVLRLQDASEVFNAVALSCLDQTFNLRIAGAKGYELNEILFPSLFEVQKPLMQLVDLCDRLAEVWDDEEEVPPDVTELKFVSRRLENLSQVIDRCKTWDQDGKHVYWLEKTRDFLGNQTVELIISPLNLDELFLKAVFQPYRSILMTSATLTIKEDFSFWASRVGLDKVENDRVLKGVFPSPFDYQDRVLLCSPTDFPLPDQGDYQQTLETYLPELLRASGGRALVLFTSYDSLKKAYQAARPLLAENNITIYKQGDEERSRLLERFKQEISSVLFATDSFWEGVDSPGETLRLVVICRLPFKVPSDPVVAARMEDLEKRGMDSFSSFSLPEAVTRFKQGFGRLMRHTTDSGCIVVLDTRIIKKNYGSVFLNSIPGTRRSFKGKQEVLKLVEDFLGLAQEERFR